MSSVGPTGYIVVPQKLIQGSDAMTVFGEHQHSCSVHGSITYLEENHGPWAGTPPPGLDKINEYITIGFDTSHFDSPRSPSIKFMIDELLEIEKWAIAVITDNVDNYMSDPYGNSSAQHDNEDDFAYALRVLEEAGRKIALPSSRLHPKEYILEVMRRIENIGEDEQEEPDQTSALEDDFDMDLIRNMLSKPAESVTFASLVEAEENTEGTETQEEHDKCSEEHE
jgi:hypothetical protein